MSAGHDEPHEAAHGSGPGPHGADDHAMKPGHEHDDHGHMDEPLGPVDWMAWSAGAFGVTIGLVTWLCFAFSTS